MAASSAASLSRRLREHAFELGFDHCAVTSPSVPLLDQRAYRSWAESGGAAGMGYMSLNPEKRVDPQAWFPEARSVVTLGVSYYQGPFPEKPGPGFGRIARYAWGEDYHTVIPGRLSRLLDRIQEWVGGEMKAVIATDTKPILERAFAKSARAGFVGKNTLLIVPGRNAHTRSGFHVGSWIFLAELLLDVPLEEESISEEKSHSPLLSGSAGAGCGACVRCLKACPTDAFEKPYRLRSDRCISYLTIENKGWIDRTMRRAMGDWLFGCDVCQDVCPFNARAALSKWPEFAPERGAGPWISLADVLALPDQKAFKRKWGQTPLSRAKRRGLVRNACVAAGNSGDFRLIPLLKNLLQDEEPLLRGHALWALSRLADRKEAVALTESLLRYETDAHVKNEGAAIMAEL